MGALLVLKALHEVLLTPVGIVASGEAELVPVALHDAPLEVELLVETPIVEKEEKSLLPRVDLGFRDPFDEVPPQGELEVRVGPGNDGLRIVVVRDAPAALFDQGLLRI